ncbi:imm11 family protein [Sphingomonas yantingensis]|uniref:Immunity MXAN-0049 protein domain-containing protein n=1 Tax=Sphingomonas yantingensis TaxID=1241761 RepID=A0A7W9ANR8_9SPHN|nr:DUF1629 domain-containing protein [Sphingomonas yantingensis]MBB5697795.1 hypothetical protein [Sphingomonas yantingensis]
MAAPIQFRQSGLARPSLETGRSLVAIIPDNGGKALKGDGELMVYSLGKKSPYDTDPRHEVVDGEAWAKVEFLRPDRVDRIARARRYPLMRYGYPVVPDSAPKTVLWSSRRLPPPDYAFGNNEIMLVSGRFRDLVERFEPDVHQFLPVDMVHKKGEAPFDTFYWFVCCQLIDSIDPDRTTLAWDGDDYEEHMDDGFRRGFWRYDHNVSPPPVPAYSLAAIGDRHLWRDPYWAREVVRSSNVFGEAMIEAELTGFAINKKQDA